MTLRTHYNSEDEDDIDDEEDNSEPALVVDTTDDDDNDDDDNDDDDNDDDTNNDNGKPRQVLLGLLWIGAGAVALVRLLQEQVAVTEILTSQSHG